MSLRTRIGNWLLGPEQRNYTDAIVQALTTNAIGNTGPLTASVAAGTGAVAGCGTLYQRAFEGAEVAPDDMVTRAVTPAVLGSMAREVVVLGETFRLIEVTAAGVRLVPISGATVNGMSADRLTWSYDGIVAAPDSSVSRVWPAARVVHVQWSFDPVRPWIGVSPLQRASISSELLAGIERCLSSESSRQTRYALPVPADPSRTDFEDWTTQLTSSKPGSLVLGRTMMGSAAAGIGSTPQRDFGERRLGPSPDKTQVELRTEVQAAVLLACGVPAAVLNADPATGAFAQAVRSFITSSVTALGRLVADELTVKLERPITLTFTADRDATRLKAATVKSLVDAGVPLERALELAGF